MEENERLLYRRQFLLGPRPAPYNNWKHLKLLDLILSTHPDLNCIQVSSGNISITLIGYLLNPSHFEDDNLTILEEFVANVDNKTQFIEKTYCYGGRWALIYKDDNDFIILHDCGSVRQIYFTNASELWCGSQPEIIAANTESKKNYDAYENLKDASVFEPWANHFWPGDGSLYVNINRLLPNHYLDIAHRKVVRYWPNKNRGVLAFQTGVDECCFLLKNLINAAGNRFQLAHSITSGWDSRLILSASKDLFESISYYTFKRLRLNRFSPDIRIPKKILKKNQHQSIEIRLDSNIDSQYDAIFRRNTSLYHENVLLEVNALLKNQQESGIEFVTINGNIGETGRCLYYDPEDDVVVTPDKLAALVNMSDSSYAIDQFSMWLDATLPIAAKFNYHILDLFHLEQKIGGWFGALRTEYDMAEEVFSPLNCRVLLDTMLQVDQIKRKKNSPALFKEMILSMWPELLDYPINPTDWILLIGDFCKESIFRPVTAMLRNRGSMSKS